MRNASNLRTNGRSNSGNLPSLVVMLLGVGAGAAILASMFIFSWGLGAPEPAFFRLIWCTPSEVSVSVSNPTGESVVGVGTVSSQIPGGQAFRVEVGPHQTADDTLFFPQVSGTCQLSQIRAYRVSGTGVSSPMPASSG